MPEVKGVREDEVERTLGFAASIMGATEEYFGSSWRNYPGAVPEHSRVVVEDGGIRAHVHLYPRTIRLGAGTVGVGLVGDVCTRPEYRRRGFGHALLDDAAEYFRAHGCPLSIISSGVFHFYTNCGYEKYPLTRYHVRVDPDPLRLDLGYRVRRFERENDLSRVAEIYSEYNSRRPLSMVRSEEYWRTHFWRIRRETADGFLVAERRGEIMGYVRSGRGEMWELATSRGHGRAAVALLRSFMRLMKKRRLERAVLYLPADEPLASVLKEEFEVEEEKYWATLVRVLDLAELLRACLPDEARADEAAVGVRCAGQEATVRVSDGRVAVGEGARGAEELSQAELMLLLTGHPGRDALPDAPARKLLRSLAPDAGPMNWPIDIV